MKEYKTLFQKIVNSEVDIISTVDHVYGSSPVRLIDSHNTLSKLENNILIVLWDTILPNTHKYKSELILDSSIYSALKKEYYLFESEKYYFESTVSTPDFDRQIKETEITLRKLSYKKNKIDLYIQRLIEIVKVYKVNLANHTTSYDFYKSNLLDLYSQFSISPEIISLIDNKMKSLFASPILWEFLPEIISLTEKEKFGLQSLMINTKLFKEPLFRNIKNGNTISKKDFIDNYELTIHQLKRKLILPSHEIVLWSFALSDIKHYGNDFGFFNNLHIALDNLSIKNNIHKLQLTLPKQDGKNFIEFENSYSFTLKDNKLIRTNTKISRVTNLISIYLHQGSKFNDMIKAFTLTGKTTKLKMGEIY